jgi:transposase
MPAKYVRPYSKGQKNDFNDAEAIAEAVQRPTMKFVASKTAEQLVLGVKLLALRPFDSDASRKPTTSDRAAAL